MRIVVNDIAASTGGALTVLKEFYNCVRENDRENEWIFLLGDSCLEETGNIKIKVRKDVKSSGIKKLLFDFVTGSKYINNFKPDVVVSLQNIITFGVKAPQLVYIHQSIPFQKIKRFSFLKSEERKLAVYQYLIGSIIKLSAKKSHKVIVQTQWIKEAVCNMCGISPQKVIQVLPNVKEIALRADDMSFRKNLFFYPTMPQIYKNNQLLMAASKQLEEKALDHRVIMTIPEKFSSGSVQCVGRMPYEQVLEYYTKATLVFPSYIETFGYPLAEAREVGTVILAADTPFAREVLDGYENGYFFDPFNPEELVALMEKVICGEIERKAVSNQEKKCNGWMNLVVQILFAGE